MYLPSTVIWKRIDFLAAIAMCMMGAILHFRGQREAADAVSRYGHNVDSGAVERILAILYCAPNALMLTVTGIAMHRQWRVRWWLQGFAILAVVCPVFLIFTFLWISRVI